MVHYRDLTFVPNGTGSGHLVVPIERTGIAANNGRGMCGLGVFDTLFKPKGLRVVSEDGNCGWVAYNPRDKLLYMKKPGQDDNVIGRYSIEIDDDAPESVATSGGEITVKNVLPDLVLSEHFGIQGAAFSDRGVLWVVTTAQPRLYAIDVNTGVAYQRGAVEVYDYAKWEGEGLTVWDLNSGIAPGISGEVHIQILKNDWSDDNLTFWHLRALPRDAL